MINLFFKEKVFRVYLGYVPFFFMMLACIYITSPEYITNLSLFNSFFLTTIYMDKLVLPVTWSLSYELYFYLLLSFLFLIRPKNTTFIFLFLTVLFINVFSERESIFFMSPFVLEFLFGSLVCIYREKLSNCNGMVVSCIVICVLSFLFGMGFKGWNGLVRVSTFGVFATALLLIAILFESKNMVFNKLLIMLGDSSYTLYLSHLIFLSLFYHTGLRDIISQQSEIVATLGFIGYMVFIIIVSHIYSKMIELPIYRASIKSMRKFQ
ncbi:acyltransferase family protein [Aeromonas hydrophila]|uniref:acyltransferase family protein n=1 Tax=Aeromonas hydrophila TaxID=644 RepID=UPI003EC66F93